MPFRIARVNGRGHQRQQLADSLGALAGFVFGAHAVDAQGQLASDRQAQLHFLPAEFVPAVVVGGKLPAQFPVDHQRNEGHGTDAFFRHEPLEFRIQVGSRNIRNAHRLRVWFLRRPG